MDTKRYGRYGRFVEGCSVEGRYVERRLVGRTFCSEGRFVEGRFVLVPDILPSHLVTLKPPVAHEEPAEEK
jgi:hypothetical protein